MPPVDAALIRDIETMVWALTWPSVLAGFLLGCMCGPSLLRLVEWLVQPVITWACRRFGAECPECYGSGRVPVDAGGQL